jgi:hypothetical protein
MRQLTGVLFAVILSSLFLVNVSISDFPPDPDGEYSPWGDLNDDEPSTSSTSSGSPADTAPLEHP